MEDEGVAFLVELVNDLVFAGEVDRATHQNERGVEGLLVGVVVGA